MESAFNLHLIYLIWCMYYYLFIQSNIVLNTNKIYKLLYYPIPRDFLKGQYSAVMRCLGALVVG